MKLRVILLFFAMLGCVAGAIAVGTSRRGEGPRPAGPALRKPSIDDTIRANIYADNWFSMHINGELVCVDSIRFMPHNVISVDLLPVYPMTIAVMAKDNGDALTGMEYGNTQIGDGGFILKFSDGTVSSGAWKAKRVSWGPLAGDTSSPRTVHIKIPEGWQAPDFDDSSWANATEYSHETVRPKEVFYAHDFEGAKFIWSADLELDNTVLLRHTVTAPPDGSQAKTFPGLENPNGNEPSERITEEQADHAQPKQVPETSQLPATAPEAARAFARFDAKTRLRWDNDYLYVESNGWPAHPMMVGISSWQQQVPLPQDYTGNNAWRIPLKPVPAKKPKSAKTSFFRGAIALAVNGVPVFNPIKNDGRTDTLLAGELDQWGGHCGRADDYHYHVAPLHLEEVVGKGNPVAYALDGYPLLGHAEHDGSAVAETDELNGHHGSAGRYHYHATKTYPYVNGGFYGEVVERDGQVDPQPQARPIRPYTRPLPGAKITGFDRTAAGAYKLSYELGGKTGTVDYVLGDNGSVSFKTVDVSGQTETRTYQRAREEYSGGRFSTWIARALWLLAGLCGTLLLRDRLRHSQRPPQA